MKITRLSTDQDNHSYFEGLEVLFDPKGPAGIVPRACWCKGSFFSGVPGRLRLSMA
ncbi:MAG: hypothetical protein WCH85_02390 [Methanomicrobiales archaeon]